MLKRDRAKYLVAALIVLRAYHCAGRPVQPGIPLGSFEIWWEWVRGALVWLGEPDPCVTMEQMRRDDPILRNHSAVLEHWHGAIGPDEVTVKQVIDKATDYVPQESGLNFNTPQKREFMFPEFREALLTVAGQGGVISGGRLGKWLGKKKGKIVNGLSFEKGESLQTWRVRQC